MGWVDLASEFSLHFETRGTFRRIPYFVPLMYSGILEISSFLGVQAKFWG